MPSCRVIFKCGDSLARKKLFKATCNGYARNTVCLASHYHTASQPCYLDRSSRPNICNDGYKLLNSNFTKTILFSSCNTNRKFSTTSVRCTDEIDKSISLDDVNSISTDDAIVQNVTEQALEPSFSSIGLGGWSPPGLVQSGMEYLHIMCDLPWWACVVCGTVIIRTAVLPLVIKFQKSVSVTMNTLPKIQILQMKMMKAREAGDLIEASRYSNELMHLLHTKNINPLKSFAIPLVQAPVFISFFFGLRGMAELPVDSLHYGGLSWFTDLTIPDPYYILPLACCSTLLLTVELGAEGGMSPDQVQFKMVKYAMRLMPVIMFPVLINFPGLILVYWLTTNMISLIQMEILRLPKVRSYFGIEAPYKPIQTQESIKKDFKVGFQESLTNLRISQEIMERKSFEAEEKSRKEMEIQELESKLKKLKDDLSTKLKS